MSTALATKKIGATQSDLVVALATSTYALSVYADADLIRKSPGARFTLPFSGGSARTAFGLYEIGCVSGAWVVSLDGSPVGLSHATICGARQAAINDYALRAVTAGRAI
ncbi:hypothetical protein ACOI1H_16285 [Loktanella sp. DJP18]|uniref:hypothetical protein n=1 Tax=Loktanella sp. DJP18 TaxID=3409788 RepID=UPI003BB55D40